ncbi:D-alanyl-D-alanine carboxypeptidase [compost metagenome]
MDQSNSPDKSAAADANSVAVLVNKEFALPEDHVPTDLVYPDVRFTFKEKIEKRMMRSEAAAALEKLFAGAEEDGIYLAGVSAYRSHSTQTSLFNRYVAKDGEEKAKTYSAVPGHSEHETGLSIDVSGSDGKCAAEDCFGDTKEAKWLAEHVGEYGYIIRYPEGKESITGYKYEPWHLRYVGVEIATDIVDNNITLEEYYNAVPVMANP